MDEDDEDEEEEDDVSGRGDAERLDSGSNEACGLDVAGYSSERSLSSPS